MLPKNVLYISYDGMLEPLGESQVLGYLTKISQKSDYKFYLISFEKSEDWAEKNHLDQVQKKTVGAGIKWIPTRYHKTPLLLATAFDIAVCTLKAIPLVLRQEIKIVHARSYVAAVSALILKILFRIKFVFDMRGFWADERADGGQWPRTGRIYKGVKWFERQFLLHADAVVSLTHTAVDEMKKFPYLQNNEPLFWVIPTCADLDRFNIPATAPASRESTEVFRLGHIGAIGNWYLFEEAVLFFKALFALNPSAKFTILNRNEHEKILTVLNKYRIPNDAYELKGVHHEQMPLELSKINAAVFFIKPFYSKKASAPTKLAELLACGIPCVVNSGVGDMDYLFKNPNLGICVSDYSEASFKDAATRLVSIKNNPQTSIICRQTAEKYFSAEVGAQDYIKLYRQILLRP